MGTEGKESRFGKQKRLRVLSKTSLPLLSWHLVLILSRLIDALWKSSSPPPACLGSIRSPSSIGGRSASLGPTSRNTEGGRGGEAPQSSILALMLLPPPHVVRERRSQKKVGFAKGEIHVSH